MTHFFARSISILFLLLTAPFIQAETVQIPLKLNFPHLHTLIEKQLFNQSTQMEMLQDHNGCSSISLSKPQLSEANQFLQIKTRVNARLGVKMINRCVAMISWEGYAQVMTQPLLKPANNRIVSLQVLKSDLFDLENKKLSSGPIWEQIKRFISPFFDRFQYDLSPSIDNFKRFLPLFMGKQPQARVNRALNSLHLDTIQVTSTGLESHLLFNIDTIPQSNQPVHALNEQEQKEWQQKWQSMDALLTETVKQYASATQQEELKLILFDILMNARYHLQDALYQEQTDTNDPVRHWFLETWSKLIPVIQEISAENSAQLTPEIMSLVTANDALQALDKVGPAIGLDISINGLRRLARLLNNTPNINLLKYDEKLDSKLIQLFQLHTNNNNNSSSINLSPISSAMADASIQNWLPNSSNLDNYLSSVRDLLLKSAKQSSEQSSLNTPQHAVFKQLVMATAWQESCWRQFVVKDKKIVPIQSATGDTGIMQVNEKVWRGFFNPQKLRWDIAYNIQFGSKILLDYMTRYAIKQNEQKYTGGLDNLARSTYSAYNGGPSQATRYRRKNVKKRYKKIDTAFQTKYLSVKQGKELTVAECLGGTTPTTTTTTTTTPLVKKKITPMPKNPKAKITTHDTAWISQQKNNNYTIQLGAFSSNKAANQFIGHQKNKGDYAVYKAPSSKKEALYSVIYGSYTSKANAKKGAKQFKKISPWIRRFKTIKKYAKK